MDRLLQTGSSWQVMTHDTSDGASFSGGTRTSSARWSDTRPVPSQRVQYLVFAASRGVAAI